MAYFQDASMDEDDDSVTVGWDFSDFEGIEMDRELQELSGWTLQPWWRKWRLRLYKRGLKKCGWLTAYPATGDACRAKPLDYKCMFGLDWQCEGDSEPAYICDCDVETRKFTCWNNTIPNPCDPSDPRPPLPENPLCPTVVPETWSTCDYSWGIQYGCNYTAIDCCGETIYADHYWCDHGHWRYRENPTCEETGICDRTEAPVPGSPPVTLSSQPPTQAPIRESPPFMQPTSPPTRTPVDTTCPEDEPRNGCTSPCPINAGQDEYTCDYEGSECLCGGDPLISTKSCTCSEAREYWLCEVSNPCDNTCLCPSAVNSGDVCGYPNSLKLDCPRGSSTTCNGETGSAEVCNCLNGLYECTPRFPECE